MHGNKKQYWINMKATTSWPKLFTLRDQVKTKKKNHIDKLKKSYCLLKFSR